MSAALQGGLNDAYLRQDVAQALLGDASRKSPQRQGANLLDIAQGADLLERSQERLRRDIEQLKMSYVFADESVTCFLSDHRAFPSVLGEAVEPLRKFFGPDKVFRLEVSNDEDELRALYVVVRWTGSPEDAAAATNRFDDEWWLERLTPAVSNLSFTCDFA
jgi:hypothetical protein